VQLSLESSKRLTTIVRIHPTMIGTMGEVGGTCEIIVFFSALAYTILYFRRNKKSEEKEIWSLSKKDK